MKLFYNFLQIMIQLTLQYALWALQVKSTSQLVFLPIASLSTAPAFTPQLEILFSQTRPHSSYSRFTAGQAKDKPSRLLT